MKQPKLLSRKNPVWCFKVLVAVACLGIAACGRSTFVASGKADFMTVSESPDDRALDELIAPYREQMESSMGLVIGYCDEAIAKAKPEGPLGNWVADLLLDHANSTSDKPVDFAIQNFGGIRIPELPAGEVTLGKIYELMPFDNMLVILEMQGDELKQMFDHMAEGDGWPISRTVQYAIDGDTAVNIMIHGMPLDPGRTYLFALPDFIANGGDNCYFLEDARRTDSGDLVRDIIIKTVKDLHAEGLAISAQTEGRVTVIERSENE